MEAENLRTASTYVNNLLLSRGLLRNGEPIDFTTASASDGRRGGTLATIINLVHDLVLRRDRETESLNDISHTLTQLRGASAQHAQTVSKLEARNAELERQASLACAQEQTARQSLKAAETRNRALREEAARLRSGAAQVRTQCAADLRRRDAELRRLQKHIETRRGRDGGAPINTTVITPGVTRAETQAHSASASSAGSATYSLKEETTEFLTQLGQNLSDENDGLISLAQTTLATLRSLQGLAEPAPESGGADPSVSATAPPACDELAADMDEVLEALRTLLTNPSFVPLEEVQVREDEICQLRASFERIEAKWKEAIGLMDGWRRRMLDSGDAVDLDDLRAGLSLGTERDLGRSTFAAVGGGARSAKRPRTHPAIAEELEDAELRAEADLAANQESPVRRDDLPLYPLLAQAQAGPQLRASPQASKAPAAPAFARAPPLRPTTANARVSIHANSPAVGALVDALSEDDDDDAGDDDIALLAAEAYRDHGAENEDPLSVAEKLEMARGEAEERRRSQERRLERLGSGRKRKVDAEEPKPVKRTAIPKRARGKRRSTLSPQELEGLMGM